MPDNLPDNPRETGCAGLDSAYGRSLVCAQRLISLNLKATQALMRGQAGGIRALMAAPDLASACRTQSEIAGRLVGQAVDYAVAFNEVVAENRKEMTGMLQAGAGGLSRMLAEGGRLPGQSTQGPMLDMLSAMLAAATHSRDFMMQLAENFEGSLPPPEQDD